jgi:hypothetical protein
MVSVAIGFCYFSILNQRAGGYISKESGAAGRELAVLRLDKDNSQGGFDPVSR